MKRLILITSIGICLAMGMVLINCGYKLAGFSNQIPDHIKTIIIPDFINKTNRFQADQYITFAVRDEFIKRSSLVLVENESRADSILEGTITQFNVSPLSYSDEASSNFYRVSISVSVRFIDLQSNEIIFEGQDITFNDSYKIDAYGGDIGDFNAAEDFFSQETETLAKIAGEFASSVVTTILENF
jgi:curli biogenesis system outer membrane secretion channel CsgG